MGINVDNVIDKESILHLICSICTDVVEDPIILGTCEHMFCRLCITEWEMSHFTADDSSNCPECRMKFFDDIDYGKPSRILLNVIAEVKFRCVNLGCQEVIKYGDYTSHSLECPNAIIQCDECGSSLERLQIEGHKERFFDKYRNIK